MKSHGVFRSTVMVAACTGLSRLLGFVREMLMAVFFGTSLAKSAFDVAFRIPNLFRCLFGEGALSAAFVPVLTDTLVKEGHEAANQLINRVATMLAVVLAIIVGVGIAVAGAWLAWLDCSPKTAAVLPLLQIMLPFTLLICLVAVGMAVLNTFRHFTIPAMMPVILNVTWIAALLWLRHAFGPDHNRQIYAIAWGIVLAGLIELVVQIPSLRRFGIRLRPAFSWSDAKVKRVVLLMGPVALGMGIHQVNVVVDGLLAMWVGDWAPAALTYSERLVYLPLGIFATALGTVLLPTFATQASLDGGRHMLGTLNSSLRGLMAVMIPATVGLILLARPIVELAFVWRGGRFDVDSTVYTVRALWFYAPGLVVFSVYKLLVPPFYALQDTRTPIRIGVQVVVLNCLLNILFVLTWPTTWAHAGLAFSTVLCSAFNCYELARAMRTRIGVLGWGRVVRSAVRVSLATLVMGVTIGCLRDFLGERLALAGWSSKMTQLGLVVGCMVAGIVVYAGAAAIFCREELRSLRRRAS